MPRTSKQAAERLTPRELRRPLAAAVIASDEFWQLLIKRLGDHVLLTHLGDRFSKQTIVPSRADLVLIAYESESAIDHREHEWRSDLGVLLGAARVPVLAYAPLSADVARATIAWATMGIAGVVYRDVDDTDGKQMVKLLRDVVAQSVSREVANELLHRPVKWPAKLREVVAALFVSPANFRSVQQLAVMAGMTPRTLERWCVRSGVVPARRVLAAARLAWVYGHLQNGGSNPSALARAAGFRSITQFRAALRSILKVDDPNAFAQLTRTHAQHAFISMVQRATTRPELLR